MRAALKKERRNWILPEPLRAQPGLEAFSPVFRQILHGRGVVRKAQLDPWLQTDLDHAPDPFLLKDMAVCFGLFASASARGGRPPGLRGPPPNGGPTPRVRIRKRHTRTP